MIILNMEPLALFPFSLAYDCMLSNPFCNCAVAKLYDDLLRSQASSSGQGVKSALISVRW